MLDREEGTVVVLYPLHFKRHLDEILHRLDLPSGFRQWRRGLIELEEQTKAWAEGGELKKEVYPHQIAFNLLPHVDS